MANKQKKIKVFWNGKRMKDIYPYATKWEVFKFKVKRFFRKVFITCAVIGVIVLVFKIGGWLNPRTELVQAETIMPPVLIKIAKAESYNSQFCTAEIVRKSGCHSYEIGSVLIHVNENKSYDIGRWAINSTHLSQAISMGYDVYKEKDNQEFALYLFNNYGSVPWNSSKATWNK